MIGDQSAFVKYILPKDTTRVSTTRPMFWAQSRGVAETAPAPRAMVALAPSNSRALPLPHQKQGIWCGCGMALDTRELRPAPSTHKAVQAGAKERHPVNDNDAAAR